MNIRVFLEDPRQGANDHILTFALVDAPDRDQDPRVPQPVAAAKRLLFVAAADAEAPIVRTVWDHGPETRTNARREHLPFGVLADVHDSDRLLERSSIELAIPAIGHVEFHRVSDSDEGNSMNLAEERSEPDHAFAGCDDQRRVSAADQRRDRSQPISELERSARGLAKSPDLERLRRIEGFDLLGRRELLRSRDTDAPTSAGERRGELIGMSSDASRTRR
ncbi:MAG: hypothetical protein SFX73_25155 [Kofleriaceae bacterium]|nr:hypothetical protein [Kofleriaceae bacterium]